MLKKYVKLILNFTSSTYFGNLLSWFQTKISMKLTTPYDHIGFTKKDIFFTVAQYDLLEKELISRNFWKIREIEWPNLFVE